MKNLALFIILAFTVSLSYTQSCLPEGITFEAQAQIDSFKIHHPNCTEIEGDVFIYDSYYDPITNLDSLNVITEIGGELLIMYTDSLQNLTGLENLTYIGGSLLFDHSGIADLSGLEGLNSIGGSLVFNAIGYLQDITALENLNSIGDNLVIGAQGTASSGGTSLINLEGLEGLDSIHGGLGITSNPSLTDISALDGLNYIGGSIGIAWNGSLATCQSEGLCNYLLNPNGAVSIYNNAPGCNSVVDLGAMCNDSIPCLPYGNYYFLKQTDIDNFPNVFVGCTELEGHFWIGPNGPMGTPNAIRGSTISNLHRLSVITSIGGDLLIYLNDSLESLSGLDNIDENSITNLTIVDNQSLSSCEVLSVCNYLALPGAQQDIEDNANGCNSRWQIQAACESVSIVEIFSLQDLIITPNPFTTSTAISYTIDKPENVQFTVYNVQSQIVFMMQEKQDKGEQKVQWNAEGLTAGMYYFRIQAGDKAGGGKMVKMQ